MLGEDICIDLVDDSVAFKLNFRKNSPIRYNIYLVWIYQHINNIVFGVMLIAIGCASGSFYVNIPLCSWRMVITKLMIILLHFIWLDYNIYFMS